MTWSVIQVYPNQLDNSHGLFILLIFIQSLLQLIILIYSWERRRISSYPGEQIERIYEKTTGNNEFGVVGTVVERGDQVEKIEFRLD